MDNPLAHNQSDRQQRATAHPQLEKMATGILGLDEVLLGGLPVGRTTLITGGPGSGKTVLALEFIYRGGVAGEPGLFVSFEERAEAVRANAATLGWDIEALEKAGTLAILHAELPAHAVRAGEFDIEGLLAVLRGHVEALGARRIALDAADLLIATLQDPERERGELHTLHGWLIDRGLTAVLTLKSQPNGGGLIYPFMGFLTDCVVHLDQRVDKQVRTRRLRVVKYRGSRFLNNEYPFLVSEDGVIVMPISTASLETRVGPGERVSSGNAFFDEVLGGGYLRGSTVLIGGPTGIGKTTLASLFAAAAGDRGEPVLYVTFEEAEQSLISGMQSAGIDMAPHVESGRLRIMARMPEANGVEEHLLDILDALDETGARHLVLDAISAVHRMGSEQAAFDFVARLLVETRRRGITTMMTTQTTHERFPQEISGIGVSSLIDTIVMLQYEQEMDTMRRRLLVLKSRGSRHSNRYHRLEITDHGVALGSRAVGIRPVEDAQRATGDRGTMNDENAAVPGRSPGESAR